jgi:SEC-C motif
MLTSICRSIVTICSGLYLLIGMTRYSSKWILSHSTWYKFRRSRHLWCVTRVNLNLPPLLRRIHAMKFYGLAQAGRSAIGAGQEAVDDFLQIMADPVGARQTMEQHVLPILKEFGLTEVTLSVRSHYAIVLAWCGDVAEARRELKALSEYGGSAEQRTMLAERTEVVEAIAAGRIHLRKKFVSPNALREIPGAQPLLNHKIGRNDPCPCGSGRKFKRCHGAN